MRVPRFALLTVGAALFVAACETGPNQPEAPTGVPGPSLTVDLQNPPLDSDNSIRLEGAKICKYGTNADFTYDIVDRSGQGGDASGNFSLVADECVLLVLADGAGADVTVTELVANLGADEQFDELVVTTQDEGGPLVVSAPLATPSATVTVHGSGGGFTVRAGAVFEFYNSVIPPTGGEGCTPGYYKNLKKHLFAWTDAGYDPDQLVSSVFSEAGNAPYAALGGATLHEGLSFRGGDSVAEKAEILLRAAIAAVLNADGPNVSYSFTSADIIADVNAALLSQDIDDILDLAKELDDENNAGCPLDNGR